MFVSASFRRVLSSWFPKKSQKVSYSLGAHLMGLINRNPSSGRTKRLAQTSKGTLFIVFYTDSNFGALMTSRLTDAGRLTGGCFIERRLSCRVYFCFPSFEITLQCPPFGHYYQTLRCQFSI